MNGDEMEEMRQADARFFFWMKVSIRGAMACAAACAVAAFLVGCQQEAREYPVAGGKVLDRDFYACKFGVLYWWGDDLLRMTDRAGAPIPCETKWMTRDEYLSQRG